MTHKGPSIEIINKRMAIGGHIYVDSYDVIPGMPETGLPTTFQFVEIDTSAAKLTPEAALDIVKGDPLVTRLPAIVQEARKFDYLRDAARMVITDHQIRSTGREMTSRYPGTDAITGDEFSAGTVIIYSRKHGAMVA